MQRRQFFKISAGVAFSLTSIPMTAIAAGSSDVRSNVLVLGGGMAGLCAAISAKQSGASKVILVEKGGFLGGHSILSGSGYWIGGTKIQKNAGIDDSLEINWQDSLERGLKLNRFLKRDTGVARLVYEQGPKDLDWLESLGVKFTDRPAQAIGNRKRVHYFAPGYRVGSPQAIKALQAKAESLGVEIILNTKLVSLITESEKRNARVIGAIVENNKRNKYAIYADHGVILATGLLNKVIAEASQKSLSTQPKNSQRKEEYARYRSLTPREKEIFKLAADGKTNKEISSLLNIALPTVKMHRGNAFDKLNVHSSVEALKLYDSLGLGEKEDD